MGYFPDDRDRLSAEQHLAAIIASSTDAIISRTIDGTIISWNHGAERLFGYRADEAIGKPATILIPPDRLEEDSGIVERACRGERVEHYDTVRRRKDGSLVEVSLAISPVKDAAGNIVGVSSIARDIGERKRAEEQRKLLLRELNHRVKNLFAVTSAVVTLSVRSAHTPQDLAKSIRGRLDALTRAHELISPIAVEESERRTTLDALLKVIFSPYFHDESSSCVHLDGPEVLVSGSAVTTLALAAHELVANAAKYGALSVPAGRVQVQWWTESNELRIRWVEEGGPPVTRPQFEGFGSSLVGRCITGQLGGRLSRDWRPEGLVVDMSMPLDRMTASST
jgi:PAS domain S-box-containing protein